MVTSPRQLLGTFGAQRLWQLNLQSNHNHFKRKQIKTKHASEREGVGKRVISNRWGSNFGRWQILGGKIVLTFALQALPEEPLEKLLAVLAHSGPGVGVDDESVRHFNFGQQDLVELDGSSNVWLGIRPLLSTNEWLWWWLLLYVWKTIKDNDNKI